MVPRLVLIASRLRFGADQWDMPSPFLDTPGANDHAPLLWNDAGTIRLFWGNPYAEGHFLFQYTISRDNGAAWSTIAYPRVEGPVADTGRPQPITTAFRDAAGTMYVPSDASGARALLWASSDGGKTWQDTLGRTGGRHTTFVPLKDGSILGLGGKDSSLDGHMPQFLSRDGGKTYAESATPFPPLASGQRPCVIRLHSGRLFFCADLQTTRKVKNASGKTERVIGQDDGAFAALSDDEGKTWRTKRLPGSQRTLGYTVCRQGPNGVIHIITSVSHPALHFELNEAWMLAPGGIAATGPSATDEQLEANTASSISDVREHRELYPDGSSRLVWSAGTGDDVHYLLHGKETWYYPGGKKQREAEYALGRKVGTETCWSPDGREEWTWDHAADGTDRWTTYWQDGRKRSESTWQNMGLVEGTDRFYDDR